jgi:hypothetical protein
MAFSFKYFFWTICLFASFTTPCKSLYGQSDEIVKALGSLTFHVKELEESNEKDSIVFTDQEIDALWQRALAAIEFKDPQKNDQIKKAWLNYKEAQTWLAVSEKKQAETSLKNAFTLLSILWLETRTFEDVDTQKIPQLSPSNQTILYLDSNHAIPKKVKEQIAPFLLAENHPMKSKLDAIFINTRATRSEKTFKKAGFEILCDTGKRSFIVVASHPKLPGYLVKAYYDTELRKKRHKSSWYWLVKRCQGASQIEKIIKKKKFKNFVVAKKWIYPLPEKSTPPHDKHHKRHHAILLVTDMHLEPQNVNLDMWYSKITTEHLDELYTIISYAGGSSYRPDNINYTRDKTFAFIDTEYPTSHPDYRRIRKYLNPRMLKYWDKLVKKGGD